MTGVLTAISDWLLAAAAGLATVAIGYARRVDRRSKAALDKADRNELLLVGDPDDPNTEGALQIVYETRAELRELRADMKTEHREVMTRLDQLQSDE